MTDHRKKNLAIDYALDLEDPDQREANARCIKEDAAVWEELALLEEVAADLTLLAPQVCPPPNLCRTIMDRIDSLDDSEDSPKLHSRHSIRSRLLSLGGWAVAACLALALVVLALRNQRYQSDLEASREGQPGSEPARVSTAARRGLEGSSGAEDDHEGTPRGGSALTRSITGRRPGIPLDKRGGNYRLQQDIDALRSRVADLKLEKKGRFQAVPGLARLTIIEMVAGRSEPGDEAVTDPEGGLAGGSSSDFPNAQNTGTDQPLGGSSTNILSDALATGLVGLGFLDPSVVPNLAAGPRASSRPDEFPASISATDEPRTDQVDIYPDLDPETQPSNDDESPAGRPNSLPMAAYTIYDETTNQGSILVQNLPAADDGYHYQLWMGDGQEPRPINVGALPELENGGGQVFFELGEGGYSPSEFFLTLEVEAGADFPTGDPVLFGPYATDSSHGEIQRPR